MNTLTRFSPLAVVLLALVPLGCGTAGDADADSAAGARASGAATRNDTMPGGSFNAPLRLATTERYRGDSGGTQTAIALKTPESVKYDSELRVYYISNINGNPSQKDSNGFIVRIHADSLSDGGSVLVMGGADSAVLNAPKGMALAGDTLWVTDIDVVRGFNRRTGAPLATVSLAAQRPVFLNDIAVGPDGALYVTATGIRLGTDGSMSHPGPDRIYRVTNRQVSVALQGDTLRGPNGIAWDSAGGRFIIAPFDGPAILSWKTGERAPSVVATGPGGYDGVEVLADGRILISSWADSSIHVVQNGQVTRLFPGVEGPADIGVNTHRQHVAVPLFSGNRVEYWAIPARQAGDTARADSARAAGGR